MTDVVAEASEQQSTRGWRGWWDRYWFEAVPPRRLDLLIRIVLAVLVYTVVDHDRWVIDGLHVSADYDAELKVTSILASLTE